jgi:hypothetical protein
MNGLSLTESPLCDPPPRPGSGVFEPAAALAEGVLDHGALEVVGGGGEGLIQADDDLGVAR